MIISGCVTFCKIEHKLSREFYGLILIYWKWRRQWRWSSAWRWLKTNDDFILIIRRFSSWKRINFRSRFRIWSHLIASPRFERMKSSREASKLLAFSGIVIGIFSRSLASTACDNNELHRIMCPDRYELIRNSLIRSSMKNREHDVLVLTFQNQNGYGGKMF